MTSLRHRNENDDEDDEIVAFSTLDMNGVNFDEDDKNTTTAPGTSITDKIALNYERRMVNERFCPIQLSSNDDDAAAVVKELFELMEEGRYLDVLRSSTARELLRRDDDDVSRTCYEVVRNRIITYGTTLPKLVAVELVGVASLNLFFQLNYTGPSFDDPAALTDVNPHSAFIKRLKRRLCQEVSDGGNTPESGSTLDEMEYRNAVLSELAVDGDLPYHLCEGPYFLLLGRCILSLLASPKRSDWSHAVVSHSERTERQELSSDGDGDLSGGAGCPLSFVRLTEGLGVAAKIWSARAVVAHQRALIHSYSCATLWDEVEYLYERAVGDYGDEMDDELFASQVHLEWGLAQHHFNIEGMGIKNFRKAQKLAGLTVEVTGAEGKRTKYQQKATAQMLVRAVSSHATASIEPASPSSPKQQPVTARHTADGLLLESISYTSPAAAAITPLSPLDFAILLSLCLDVQNTNPTNDDLTAEEMAAYLERVLSPASSSSSSNNDDIDWTIFSTGLLERAWLEFDKSWHTKERSLLQLQALLDQHTSRLTLTQSTYESVESSAPVQKRLRHLHKIVYPPRWELKRDLAERYAAMGIVTSAAELYEELELWQDVVDCYKTAGKEKKAEGLIRSRFEKGEETPRLWCALGDITKDVKCYEAAVALSGERFAEAFTKLGRHRFDVEGDLVGAGRALERSVGVKPLQPRVWFLLGTVRMRLEEWGEALKAFSEVVAQEPEEGEAWSNVAAVHLKRGESEMAYFAILESLKQNRNNWRIWTNKLYTCLDLQKTNEAIQSCHTLLELRKQKPTSVPPLEEKCVRAIVGQALRQSAAADDDASRDAASRTVERVREFLKTLEAHVTESWVYETKAHFEASTSGRSSRVVLDDLMKEYRALQAGASGWEMDGDALRKICRVAMQIVDCHKEEGGKESLSKGRFLIKGLIGKIKNAGYLGEDEEPEEVRELEHVLGELQDLIRAL